MRCHARAAMKLDVSAGLLTADWTRPQSGSTRPSHSLVRTHCGLRRVYGFVHVLRRRVRRRLTCGTAVCRAWLEATTCGFGIPDSPSARHAPWGNSGGYDSDRKPVSSANVPARTTGGPRRARTDDLRINRERAAIPARGGTKWALLTDPWVIFGLGGRVGGRRG
jgi:hypothetical protein